MEKWKGSWVWAWVWVPSVRLSLGFSGSETLTLASLLPEVSGTKTLLEQSEQLPEARQRDGNRVRNLLDRAMEQ